jgi:hypothetical protein
VGLIKEHGKKQGQKENFGKSNFQAKTLFCVCVKTSRHLDMKMTCFGQVSFPAEGFVFQGQSSRSRMPVVKAQVIDSDEGGGVRPLPSVRAPNARGRLRRL